MKHEHASKYRSQWYEVCACGAVRRTLFGTYQEAWHSCSLCYIDSGVYP